VEVPRRNEGGERSATAVMRFDVARAAAGDVKSSIEGGTRAAVAPADGF
jgi:hypothetical protein